MEKLDFHWQLGRVIPSGFSWRRMALLKNGYHIFFFNKKEENNYEILIEKEA